MLKTWANIWLSLDLCCSIILFIPTFDPSKDRHTDLPDEANTFLFVGPRLHHRSFSPKRLKEGCKDQKTLGFGWVLLIGWIVWFLMILDDRWLIGALISIPFLASCSVDIGEVAKYGPSHVAKNLQWFNDGCCCWVHVFYACNSRNSGGDVMVQWNSSNEDSFQCGCPKENDGCIYEGTFLVYNFIIHSLLKEGANVFFVLLFRKDIICKTSDFQLQTFPTWTGWLPMCSMQTTLWITLSSFKQSQQTTPLESYQVANTTETFTSTRCLNWLSHLVLEWSSFDMDPCGLHMCLCDMALFCAAILRQLRVSVPQVQYGLRVSGGLPNTCGARRGVSSVQ